MTVNLFYFLLLFIGLNIRAFILMYKDKDAAVRNESRTGQGRIPEASLFLNSLLLGFVGIGLGMILLRHKIRKSYFKFGVPITGIVNIALYNLLKEKMEEDYDFEFIYDSSLINSVFETLSHNLTYYT